MYQLLDGSGSGKSASYVIPNAYQLLGSYVFTDPKGELYDKTAGYLRENGYDIKILNKNKGIILAENNYLPVDKRGNVNVLVVGRFRFW